MNVTELARILKITPNELKDYLPLLGFDIGRKAVKINNSVANKIIREWPMLKRKLERIKEEKEGRKDQKEQIAIHKSVTLPGLVTIRDFSNLTGVPINVILSELMKNGIFASLNEKIDFDTAWLIGSELGIEVTKKEGEAEEVKNDNVLKEILAQESQEKLLPRPPVIVVMGHVDHGKTKLLDTIRTTHVVEGEAGGITQHIGAYQVKKKNQLITFIDTPGHEAFTAMRSRGAKIADVAILIVAADDGVKPQTVEAYRIIEAAKIPFVVAINKIDKEEANIDKTKQELSTQLNILPEDWGGKVVCVPVSAQKGTNIDELLDMVLLIAESSAENIKANPEAEAVGTVIESHLDKGSGPVATILIQNGTIKIGDQLMLDNMSIGKVRRLNNYRNENIPSAEPATPVQIIGLKMQPKVGDIIRVGEGEKFNKKVLTTSQSTSAAKSENANEDNESSIKINLIVKSDVLGSSEAIEESLEKINTKEVQAKIIHKGLGNITDGDIKRAEASQALILGFNVKIPPVIEELAREKNVEIKLYRIIYDLINEVKARMQAAIVPTIKRVDLGRLKVLGIFRTEKNSQIIGGKIISGKAENNTLVELVRGDDIICQGKIVKLQAGKQDVQTVEINEDCGIQFEGKPLVQVGDILNIYKEEKIFTKL